MRKAQIGDAAREYAQLARRLDHEEIDPQYAALAHLAAARLETHRDSFGIRNIQM